MRMLTHDRKALHEIRIQVNFGSHIFYQSSDSSYAGKKAVYNSYRGQHYQFSITILVNHHPLKTRLFKFKNLPPEQNTKHDKHPLT